MEHSLQQESTRAVILIMGATGTGKSSFINLLTDDDKIHVGHTQQSETFGVQTAHYIDHATGRLVTLVDTPGFDDSREHITDTDILEKIVRFLEFECGEAIDVTGIIYMHRISDPRVGGAGRKNLRLLCALCGEENFGSVRIVTTNWSRVTVEEGNHRESDLIGGVFKAPIDAGARMRRHEDTFESALQIMSELIPLSPITLKIQEEVRAGKRLMDTSAGRVLAAEMQEMVKKHEQELADLKREMDSAEEEKNRSLIAELEQDCEALQEKMKRADADRKVLESTLVTVHIGTAEDQGSFANGRRGDRDTPDALNTVRPGLEDLMSPEHRAASRHSELNMAWPRDDLDVTEQHVAQPRREFPGTRRDALYMHRNLAEERQFKNAKDHLEALQDRIRDLENKRTRRAQAAKMCKDCIHWVAEGVVDFFS